MKNLSSKITFPILIVVIVIVLGIIGYVYSKDMESFREISGSERSNGSERSEGQGEDEYAGWKIYEDSEQRFSVKYPSFWTFCDMSKCGQLKSWDETTSSFLDTSGVYFYDDGKERKEYSKDTVLGVNSGEEARIMTVLRSNLDTTVRNKENAASKEDIIVAGKYNAKRYNQVPVQLMGHVTYVIIYYNPVFYIIEFRKNLDDNVINEVLNSFEIKEKEEIINKKERQIDWDEYNRWKTYAQTDLNFSIKYPSDWIYEENYNYVDRVPSFDEKAETGVKSVTFFTPDKKYKLYMLYVDKEKYPDANVVLRDTSKGEYEKLERDIFVGSQYNPNAGKLIQRGDVIEILYTHFIPTLIRQDQTAKIGNVEFYITLNWTDVYQTNIPEDVQLTAEKILKSLEVKDQS